ncbi:ribonuclease P protein component [Actinomyces sp. 594]|uniref:ribonuclease P protein component n=1 Tax=Actinomyces sp. 594 TaxID=2057793 RepID=UPI00280B92F6|nr:ribonuclease P protein component [Actinomyces sp. 594]
MPAAPSWPRAGARAAPVSPPEVLPASHRMLRSEDFTAAVRSGARSGSRRLVVHYCAAPGEVLTAPPVQDGVQGAGGAPAPAAAPVQPARIGVVVSKKQVARATHRNRIKRRVRALLRERLDDLEPGARIVVRGLAGADGATSAELAADLDRLLTRSRALAHTGRRR